MDSEGWGIFEIVIVIILVVAVLNRLFGTPKVDDIATKPATPKTEQKTPPKVVCDKLSITKPKSLEKITVQSQGVSVVFSIPTCATVAVYPDTFLVSVVDSQGVALSAAEEARLEPVTGGWGANHFARFSATPKTGTGYLIITRISNTGEQVSNGGARLPIRFVN